MGAFAAHLKRLRNRRHGSDQNVYPPMSDVLKNSGVELVQRLQGRESYRA